MPRLVFIHNPKTAGASFRQVFRHEYAGHIALDEWYAKNKGMLKRPDLFVAAFVRDPWERLYSWYHHAHHFDRWCFEQYVVYHASSELYRAGIRYTHHLIATQEPWVESKIRPLDFTGKFESLEVDFCRLCNELNKGYAIAQLPHKHKSETKTTAYSRGDWSEEMLAAMAPQFEPFAEKYGYA